MCGKGWGIVLTGGTAPPKPAVASLLSDGAYVVAADSGLDLAHSYDVRPDAAVGDMDSLRRVEMLDSFEPDRIRRFSHEKDETDTEIAVRTVREAGCRRVAVIGGGGGRIDHLVALLALFERPVHPALWVVEDACVAAVDEEIRVLDREGDRISFFPVGDVESRMESVGLKWSLNTLRWRHGDHGVSNRITKNDMRVRMKSGRLIMVGSLGLLQGVEW